MTAGEFDALYVFVLNPLLVALAWNLTLRFWRRWWPGTYWHLPLRTAHAYLCPLVVLTVSDAASTMYDIRIYHAGNPDDVRTAWGWVGFNMMINSVLLLVPALIALAWIADMRKLRPKRAE